MPKLKNSNETFWVIFKQCANLRDDCKTENESKIAFQERHGWERPGWFSTQSVSVQKYDWYGAYEEVALNEANNGYKDNLLLDYTFEYPKIHDNVCLLHCSNQKK